MASKASKKDVRQCWASVFVIFIVSLVLGFVFHGAILGGEYAALGKLFRSAKASHAYFPVMLLAHFIGALGFVMVYRKGREKRPVFEQGLRFGLYMMLLYIIPIYMITFAVQPIPGMLVIKQVLLDSFSVLIMGVIVAKMNKA